MSLEDTSCYLGGLDGGLSITSESECADAYLVFVWALQFC